LFSYGITNAGKTHTVLGNISKKKEAWGLVPRAVSDALDRLPPTAHLTMSYFEIYNENVYDLLPQSLQNENVAKFADPLKVREWHGRAVVSGLAKHRLHSLQQGLDLIVMAKQRRHTATNNINRDSSRSHCVCQLTVET
ncbi:kinesin family-like protein, partial [Phaeodactylum tricornutum CCAP 1055/1]